MIDQTDVRNLATPRGSLTRRQFLRGTAGSIGATETTILAIAGLRTGRLESLVFYNSTGGNIVVTAHIVPAGGTAGAANEIVNETLASHARLAASVAGIGLGQGDIISAKSDTATSLNAWASAEIVEGG